MPVINGIGKGNFKFCIDKVVMRKSRKSEFGRGYFDGKFAHFIQIYYLNNEEWVKARRLCAVEAAGEKAKKWQYAKQNCHINSLKDAYDEGYNFGYQSWTDEDAERVLGIVLGSS